MSESEAPAKTKRARRKSSAQAEAGSAEELGSGPKAPEPKARRKPALPAEQAPARPKRPRKPRAAAEAPPEAEAPPARIPRRIPPPPLRRYALQEAIEAFQRDVLELLTPKPVKDWKRKLAVRWRRERDSFRNKTPATQKLYSSRFRAPLRKTLEEAEIPPHRIEIVFEVVRIEREMMAAVNEEYRLSVDAANRNLARIPDWRAILDELTRMLDSEDPRFLALGLMGVTGRRFVEILKFGSFAPVFSHTRSGVRITQKWLLEFAGQAKTRGAENTMFGKAYAIPILAPSGRTLEAFARLRASREGRRWAEMTPAQLNSSTNPAFNKLLREYPPIAGRWPANLPLTLKTLRALYAEIAMESFAPPMTKGPYFARILGHSETQYETALSYMTFSLSEKGDQAGMSEIHRLLMLREEDRQAREDQPAKADSSEEDSPQDGG